MPQTRRERLNSLARQRIVEVSVAPSSVSARAARSVRDLAMAASAAAKAPDQAPPAIRMSVSAIYRFELGVTCHLAPLRANPSMARIDKIDLDAPATIAVADG
jgi:hypothetical protein